MIDFIFRSRMRLIMKGLRKIPYLEQFSGKKVHVFFSRRIQQCIKNGSAFSKYIFKFLALSDSRPYKVFAVFFIGKQKPHGVMRESGSRVEFIQERADRNSRLETFLDVLHLLT